MDLATSQSMHSELSKYFSGENYIGGSENIGKVSDILRTYIDNTPGGDINTPSTLDSYIAAWSKSVDTYYNRVYGEGSSLDAYLKALQAAPGQQQSILS